VQFDASKPAATAFFAACSYSAIAALMSASVIAFGVGCGFGPSASVYISPAASTAEGPTTAAPCGRLFGCPMRPVCISWTKIFAPLLCAASVTFFQPATCAAEKMPGMRG